MERFDDKTIAKLLLSIKPPRRGMKRPFSPIEVAKLFQEACRYSTIKEVAKRAGISQEMVREFLKLLSLPPDIQRQLFSNWDIGIDKGYRLSMLKDEKEQRRLANAILNEKLSSNEVRAIVYLKKKNQEMPISDCIKEVLRLREKTKHHLILTGIDQTTLRLLKKKATKYGVSTEDIVKKIIKRNLPSSQSLIEFKMQGTLISMIVNSNGFQKLKSKAKEKGVNFDDIVERLVEEWMTTND